MESRLAVLEQIAREPTAALARVERRQAPEQRADFRWLPGVMLAGFTTLPGAMGAMLGVMAHGFHWL